MTLGVAPDACAQMHVPKVLTHLDREQPCQVDLGDSLGSLLLFHATTLGLALVYLVGWSHQVPHSVLLLQKGMACGKHRAEEPGPSLKLKGKGGLEPGIWGLGSQTRPGVSPRWQQRVDLVLKD
jgi:hypothetical protein